MNPSAPVHIDLVSLIQAIGTLVSLGIAGWAKWSIHQVAKEAAREEMGRMGKLLDDHDGNSRAHRALVEAWEGAREKALVKSMDALGATLKSAVIEALVSHNRDPWAHPEGSENRIAPLKQAIEKIHETMVILDKRLAGLDGFIAEMRELKREHDDIIKRAADWLPRHPGRG